MVAFFLDGGIWDLIVGGLLVIGLVWWIVDLVLALKGRRADLSGVSLAIVGLVIGVGLIGAAVSFSQTVDALPRAPADQRAAFELMSLSISLNPFVVACLAGSVGVLLASIAKTLRVNRPIKGTS